MSVSSESFLVRKLGRHLSNQGCHEDANAFVVNVSKSFFPEAEFFNGEYH